MLSKQEGTEQISGDLIPMSYIKKQKKKYQHYPKIKNPLNFGYRTKVMKPWDRKIEQQGKRRKGHKDNVGKGAMTIHKKIQ